MSGAVAALFGPWSVRHLAHAISPNHDPKRLQMAMFTAYFDASGDPNQVGMAKALTVCGFVSTVEKWHRFVEAWPALLDEHKIPSPFHMADFMARAGIFKDWEGDADAFRLAVGRLLKRTTNKPLAAGVVIADLRRMFDVYEVPADIVREPYPWCGLYACGLLIKWANNRVKAGALRGSDQVQIIFEDGDLDRGRLKAAAWDRFKIKPAFLSNEGKDFSPFAACDFLAWEFRRWIWQRTRGHLLWEKVKPAVAKAGRMNADEHALGLKAAEMMKPDPVIVELTRQFPQESLYFADWKRLVHECEKLGYPKRPDSNASASSASPESPPTQEPPGK